MKRYFLGTALVAAMPVAAAAQDCGEVSIAEMNWASAQIVVAVSEFILTQGYSCDVTVVPSDTTPAVTSLSENNEPDVVPEMWPNSAGAAYEKLKENGRIVELTNVLDPGGVEGWWIPTYLAEEHPELTTIEGVLANPELVGGMFNNCPDGWGCRIVSDNLARAYDLEGNGIEVFNHGSGETLATSMASAYENEEPWFGYYWGPTTPLGKFDMTSVDLGDYDEEAHAANQNADTPDPKPSAFPTAPILTVMTKDFSDNNPELADFFSKVSFKTSEMSQLLAWQDENNASTEEAAVYYLQNNKEVWSEWLNDEARGNLSSLLEQ
ncbi:ABC transporter substrate-binding protein [Salipiger marinus]|jgi:glycine betaine/proline transport system substrate-binding protein|uniref:Glycine betaine/proline transport system substrate-binding protein n=1 Tax=Salipiger marinus TaxID=555512 RepID=A0A1G8KYF1_9RHOB|nr:MULTISPECIES: ABC transporter substrate-binding protein [Salipiger]MCD1618106.1 ABC transporter substrate-binding protein [Salipiger manganoxidans]MEB3418788.1 ABC transporter substrate-binding protein [Salipiger manganoxidans]SDI48367.1 glycine betaine/proline transport system substrate-binding protein [Salipiger marinus]HBM59046.1 glycine/betaine ABC transporter substrate-binding protein [Citreicella sp.]